MTSTSRFTLSARRRQLLESLLRAEGIDRSATPAVPKRPDPAAPVPLAFPQSRFWFLDRYSANAASYVISAALRVRGGLRSDVFTAACAEVVARHESLRTVFTEVDGVPVQRVRAELPPEVDVVDLRGTDPADVPAEVERREAELVARPFDLSSGPLLRVRLLEFADDDTAVLVNIHHIVCDRWSMGVLMHDLVRTYAALASGARPDLPPLPVQYADFARWQVDGGTAAWESDVEHWTRQLAGAPAEIGLPTPFPRPREKTYRGSSVPFTLPRAVVARLRELSRAEGATLFMALTAAFKMLLARLSGEHDVVVGTPVANRTLTELEPLVGCFLNTLALRTDLAGDPDYAEVLRRVAAVCLAAYDHQAIPFEQLVQRLRPHRSPAHTPVFQVLVSYQNVPLPPWDDGPVRVRPMPLPARKAEFDLLLELFEDGDAVTGKLEYSTDLYDEPAARELVERFTGLLADVAADPGLRLSAVRIADPGRRQAGEVRDWPDRGWVHECVGDRALDAPDAVAVRAGEWSLDRAGLDRAANRLAHWLRRLGVGAGALVGVRLPRAPETAVAVLAVLRTGAAVAPLDPALPADRVARFCDRAGVSVLLTRGGVPAEVLDGAPNVEPVDLDELDGGLSAESDADPGVPVHGDDLALVAFPSGAMIPHRALRNAVLVLQDLCPLDGTDRVVRHGALTAESAVRELLWPLVAGAAVVVADASPARTIRDERVTVACFTPARLREFLHDPASGEGVALRHVLCGGEALPRSLRELAAARLDARLHHLFGTPETTGAVTAWTCGPRDGDGAAPIGAPVANTEVLLLDAFDQPVPAGAPGELVVAGAGLAAGRVGDEGGGRFGGHPFDPDRLVFRTGDLARVRPDGALEWLGRVDEPMRRHGFRVDRSRVEAVLDAHPAVRAAVLVDRAGEPVACVTVDGSTTGADVLRWAGERLPDPLVPAAVEVVGELPLTSAGTVDRAALSAPTAAGAVERFVGPRDELEHSVARAWRELLGVARVGVHDDFFDLGGHSLLVTKLAAWVRSEHGVHVPLRELFDGTTVAAMAERIRRGDASAGPAPIPAADRSAALPLSFAQRDLCEHGPLPPEDPFHNVVTAIALTGVLDVDALRAALDDIVRRHEPLRSRVVRRDGAWTQQVLSGGTWPLSIVDFGALGPAARRAALRGAVLAEEHRGFSLAQEPPVRAVLIRLAEREHVLVQVMHHLVTDNWSYGVLLHEMSRCYAARVLGREADLPALPVAFADVAAWQQRRLAAGALDADLAHWRVRLADLPPPPRFTAPAHQDPAPPTGAVTDFTVEPGEAAALRALGRAESATLFAVLMSAFQVLLSAYSGHDDVVVDFPVAGRERPETANLIGFLVNHLAIRVDLSDDPSFRELVRRVRADLADAQAHQGAPLRAVTDRDLTRITFNLLNAALPELALPGLTVAPAAAGLGDDYVFTEVVADFGRVAVDLGLIVREDDTGALRGVWLHAPGAVEPRALAAMAAVWPVLLRAVVTDPDRRVGVLRALLLGTELGRRG
ncbi:condensation domain-containing protein [Actinosynnema sp. NPDC059335]|uniref:condensation domain-containing protein n=1 Tax=Actinosynnema sp. NPDC059335 TaxID=3346804 RepID=UPI00366AE37D